MGGVEGNLPPSETAHIPLFIPNKMLSSFPLPRKCPLNTKHAVLLRAGCGIFRGRYVISFFPVGCFIKMLSNSFLYIVIRCIILTEYPSEMTEILIQAKIRPHPEFLIIFNTCLVYSVFSCIAEIFYQVRR